MLTSEVSRRVPRNLADRMAAEPEVAGKVLAALEAEHRLIGVPPSPPSPPSPSGPPSVDPTPPTTPPASCVPWNCKGKSHGHKKGGGGGDDEANG